MIQRNIEEPKRLEVDRRARPKRRLSGYRQAPGPPNEVPAAHLQRGIPFDVRLSERPS